MNNLQAYFFLDHKPELLVIVNRTVKELEEIADQIISEYHFSFVCLGKEISQLLITEPHSQYTYMIVDWLSKQINELENEPVLLKDIDLLFDPSLGLDPLTLFKQISKVKELIVLWPGEFNNNNLSYASPEHAHYRTWANPGIEIIQA